MTRREVVLAPIDTALLGQLERETTLAAACERLGISIDRGAYRLRRLARALRSPVVRTGRGGAGHGRTRLTEMGREIRERGSGAVLTPSDRRRSARGPSELVGTYRVGSPPTVRLRGGPTLAVSFVAEPDERVSVSIDPASILLATGRFPTSARNVLAGVVRAVRSAGPETGYAQRRVEVAVGRRAFSVAVTPAAVESLGLRPRRAVYLYVKATAVRRLAG